MYSFYAYLINGIACLAMAAMLFIKDNNTANNDRPKHRTIRLIAAWPIVESVTSFAAMANQGTGDTQGNPAIACVAILLHTAVCIVVCMGVTGTCCKCTPKDTEPAETSTCMCQPDMSSATIDDIVNHWTQRSDHPYLREGITVVQVAEEMGISPRLLSQYINNVRHFNFNTWINQLKVTEVKRLIDANNDMSLLLIANRTGFTDASAMSKIFKTITGMSPSTYRNRDKTANEH